MGKVTEFRLAPESAQEVISRVARDSSRVYFVDTVSDGLWEARVTRLQIIQCLREGVLIGKPILNGNRDWQCVMERFAVGVCIRVTVVMDRQDDGNYELIIIKLEKR